MDEKTVLEALKSIEAKLIELRASPILHVRNNAERALVSVQSSIFNLGDFPRGITAD